MAASDEGFRIRDGKPEDVPLILHSWVRSYTDSPIARATGQGQVLVAGHKRLIVEILSRPETRVRVACHAEDDDTIFGWSCGEPGRRVLHYVYVKRGPDDAQLRRLGIARHLLSGWDIERYSHRTNICAALPIPRGWAFDPYEAWSPEARPEARR